MNRDLSSYYRNRAHEYEKIYDKPERQEDLFRLTGMLREIFSGKELLEIACGTGYWTERIAETAREILATDINNPVLNIARSKNYSNTKVTFRLADFNNIHSHGTHESLFGGFIWSHIKLEEINMFLDVLYDLITPAGMLVFIDNNYVESSSLPISYTDKNKNTYQTRKLENGTEHLVLKNFPSEEFLIRILKERASEIEYIKLKYYWILKFKKPYLN